ncbi:MAG: methyltransferase domain-containing protein [Thermoanaerobaculia bacterium]
MSPAWACPECGENLEETGDEVACGKCGRRFPVLFGIPDLRLQGDRYLDLDSDRRRAAELDEAARRGARFEDLLALYWQDTPGTPAALARNHIAGAIRSAEDSRPLVDSLPGGRFLDVGCGAGGALVAAASDRRFTSVLGIDSALRWLVVARQHLRQTGSDSRVALAAASVESPPFRAHSFDSLLLRHLLEHVRDLRGAVSSSAELLSPGGGAVVEVFQRWSVLPEPHTGLLGASWLPRRWQPAYVRWRCGDDYSAVRLPSRREVLAAARESGLRVKEFLSLPITPGERRRMPAPLGPAVALYEVLRRSRGINRVVLSRLGPKIDLSMSKDLA